MATHSNILAWKSHGRRSLAGYSLWGHKRARHDLVTKQQQQILKDFMSLYHYFMITHRLLCVFFFFLYPGIKASSSCLFC